MASYAYFIKIKMLMALSYRFEAFSATLMQFIVLVVSAFFWRAVYAGRDAVQDTTLEQMLVYTIMSVLLNCFFSTGVEDELQWRIGQGEIAVDIIKPVNLFGMYLAGDAGQIVVNMAQKGLPLLLFAWLFVARPVPASLAGAALFLFSAGMSFLVLWLIAAIFGLLNFWLIDVGNIGGVKNYIIAFLSGSVVPLWFFPAWVQKAMAFLPFIYIYQTPISFYIGKTLPGEAPLILAVQLGWVLVFFGLFLLMKRKAMGHLVVQGG
jgi:ABC-2 type transport system permease protein